MIIKQGDILLVNKNKFFGNLIGWFQGNEYHHAGIFVRMFGKLYVFEAVDNGMAFTDFEDYKLKVEHLNYELLVLQPKEDLFDKVNISDYLNLLLPLTQKSYEFRNLLGFQAVRYLWLKIFGKTLWIGHRKSIADKEFICSELVAYIYNRLFGMFSDWHKLAPTDLFNSKDFKHTKYRVK